MICSEFNELLDSYESITDEQRIEMEKHTVVCETCRKEYEFFKSIMSNLASIPSPEAPKTLIDKVNKKLDEEKTVVVGFKWNFRVLSTVAACLVIGLAVGINNGYIKDAITEKDADGVISRTVVEESEVPEEIEAPAETMPAAADEPEIKDSAAEQAKIVKPASTQKPVVKATKAPARTEAPKPAATENAQVQEAAPVQTPDSVQNVEDYQIKSDGPQIAYGRYNVESTKRKNVEFSDYLHVESDDMGAVVSTMSEMGVRNSGGYYMTSRDNFYALINRLNDRGVGYECDLQYNSGDNISFRLTYN